MSERELLERVHADNRLLREQVTVLLEKVASLERALAAATDEKERLASIILRAQLNPHRQRSDFTPAEARELVEFLKKP
ncbi:MAG: hypothetical protein ACOZQL_40150 [Myxococcota bacterium]